MLTTYFILILVSIGSFVELSYSATTHKHSQGGSKERTDDGAYAPRDIHHYDADEHHSEFDHEAILGSKKEAEEFDQLSPDESKKRLAILVRKMDLNDDGYVDRHELKAWILRSFKNLSEDEANERFEDIDVNNDERVTWEEYLKDTYGMDDEDDESNFIEPQNSEELKLIASDRVMFNASDLNQDGWLNPNEFQMFSSPEEHPEMLPVILQETLNEKDLNGDGRIDFQEFVAEAARTHDKEWLVTEKERFDNDHDKDQDGFLNGNEILSWVVPSNDEVATDEVNHLFATADDDQDDRLSYHEIIENYDTFVGSEATDYGDHLHNIHHFDDEL